MCHQFESVEREQAEDLARAVHAYLQQGVDFAMEAFDVGINLADAEQAAAPAASAGVQKVGPGSSVAVITDSDFLMLTWGFTVNWQKQPVYNARIETALRGTSMWSDALAHRRCIIPAHAFYETHRTETCRSVKTGRRIKRAYRFAREDGTLLFLAGIYENDCFAVVTTEPNDCVSAVHDRMPIALKPEEIATWLAGDFKTLANRSQLTLCATPEQADADSRQLRLF